MDDLDGLFLPFIAFLFALFFYYASKQQGCWYRRYVFPAMFVVLAASQLENMLAAALYLLAAALSGLGYKGYGKEKIEDYFMEESIILQ